MTLSVLDRQTALLVVDLQKGISGYSFLHPIGEVTARARALIDAFRDLRLPVVLINVAGGAPGRTEEPRRLAGPLPTEFTEFLPQLGHQADDIVVTKHTWGAFTGTGLEAQLKARGVTQVVIAGVATGTGVEATARQAFEAGFNVTLALDAMTDARPEAHAYSIKNVFPRLGETGTTTEIIALLSARSA